jgi:hypothetical protein
LDSRPSDSGPTTAARSRAPRIEQSIGGGPGDFSVGPPGVPYGPHAVNIPARESSTIDAGWHRPSSARQSRAQSRDIAHETRVARAGGSRGAILDRPPGAGGIHSYQPSLGDHPSLTSTFANAGGPRSSSPGACCHQHRIRALEGATRKAYGPPRTTAAGDGELTCVRSSRRSQ